MSNRVKIKLLMKGKTTDRRLVALIGKWVLRVEVLHLI